MLADLWQVGSSTTAVAGPSPPKTLLVPRARRHGPLKAPVPRPRVCSGRAGKSHRASLSAPAPWRNWPISPARALSSTYG